jgi:uncharacterized protein (DUF1330 family)
MSANAYIEPTDQQVADLVAETEAKPGPVTMINLLRFKADGGRESYLHYAEEVRPHIERVGASVGYAGDASGIVIGGDDSAWWDSILVVHYPSRAAFLDMVSDPAYLKIAVYRTKALVDSRLIATDPWAAA